MKFVIFVLEYTRMKEPLFGRNLEQLQELVKELGLPAFTARQLAGWLYKKDIVSIDEMSNISMKAREALKEKYDLGN